MLSPLTKTVRTKSANKGTENIANMDENDNSKVKVHVNLENLEKQTIQIGVIEAECLEINKNISVKDTTLVVKKQEKLKIDQREL